MIVHVNDIYHLQSSVANKVWNIAAALGSTIWYRKKLSQTFFFSSSFCLEGAFPFNGFLPIWKAFSFDSGRPCIKIDSVIHHSNML